MTQFLPSQSEIRKCQLSTQLLIHAAIRKGLSVDILDGEESLIRVRTNTHIEIVYQATMTRLDTLACRGLLRNKAACKYLMTESGISVIPGFWRPADQALQILLSRRMEADWVVKPNTQFQGTGISFVERGDSAGLAEGVRVAAAFSNSIVAEHWVRFPEYRFLVLGGVVHSVLRRTAPTITGDGQKTLAELIAIENRRRREMGRPAEYDIALTLADVARLQKTGIHNDSVISKDTTVVLRYNTNIHTGGNAQIADNVHTCYLAIAESVAKCLGGSIIGIDFLISNIERPVPTEAPYYVIEANFNPDISLHAEPTIGIGKNPADDILEMLGF